MPVPFRSLANAFSRPGGLKAAGQLLDRNFEDLRKSIGPETVQTAKTATTSATPSTILTVPVPAETTVTIEVTVVARRTGGSSGTDEDGAGYKRYATYKNLAGTATLIGSVSSAYTAESQAGWDVTFSPSSAEVNIQVTGASNNDIAWLASARVLKVST